MPAHRDIPGYEGVYAITKTGIIYSYRRQRYLKTRYVHGRAMAHLCVDNEHKFRFIHKLVYLTYVGPVPVGLEIDHINEDKTDNRLENLQAITHQENVQKYFDMRSIDKRRTKSEY